MIASASAACLGTILLLATAPLGQGFFAPPIGSAIPHISCRDSILGSRQDGMFVIRRMRALTTVAMGLASSEDAVKVVVCGPPTGIAGLVAERLSAAGGARQVLLAKETEELSVQLSGANVVVGSSDGGPDAEEAPPGLADEIVTALAPETQYLIWVDSPESREAGRQAKKDMGVIGGLLGRGFKESLEAVQSVEGGVKCLVVHTGRLFGAARGEEPVPFLTGPKAEPVLDESITRQAVLLGAGTVLSSPENAATKRSSVAEVIERLLGGPERRSGVGLSVVSAEGFAATDEEWQEAMARLDDSEGAVAVFSIDFEALEKKDQMIKWLAESWGPAALRKSTAAMLRSGARPVAVSPTPQGLELVWETLTEDLTAVKAGKLLITVSEQPPGLRVVRVAGPGQPQGKALSGEEEIVQSLLEGINAVAYPKAMARRKAPKVSLVGAAAAAGRGRRGGAKAATETSSVATSASVPAGAPASRTSTANEGAPNDEPTPAPASPKGRGRRSGGKRRKSP